ncbi:MAG: cytochrome b/b6 domain-containing protein [Cohaesibacter sp.]|jgi:cytochrome b561|nr:cytochrome b/b6 domain-containing protein [Cohaesibacter sp.]
MTTSSPSRYSKVTIALHWLGALLILGLIVVGQMMDGMQGPEKLELLDMHRKIGLVTGLIFLVRLVFFFLHARPEADPNWPPMQAKLAKAIHLLLYLLPLVMVASGMASLMIFGLGQYVDNGDIAGYLAAAGSVPPLNVHGIVAKLLVASVVLHVIGAIYHQFVKKDGIMTRMSLRS